MTTSPVRRDGTSAATAPRRRAPGATAKTAAASRRSHSREGVIDGAIEVLDAGGIDALTFRALAAHLSTGAGAIYHHVRDKDDLLAAAASRVLLEALDLSEANVAAGATVNVAVDVAVHVAVDQPTSAADVEPASAVRAALLAAYDAVVARPWLGAQLTAAPWQPAVLQLLDVVGSRLDALAVPDHLRLDAASLLVQHVLGVASQRAAADRLARAGTLHARDDFLAEATSMLTAPADGSPSGQEYPFLQRMAAQLSTHDDHQQFLTGVDIILRGITTA